MGLVMPHVASMPQRCSFLHQNLSVLRLKEDLTCTAMDWKHRGERRRKSLMMSVAMSTGACKEQEALRKTSLQNMLQISKLGVTQEATEAMAWWAGHNNSKKFARM